MYMCVSALGRKRNFTLRLYACVCVCVCVCAFRYVEEAVWPCIYELLWRLYSVYAGKYLYGYVQCVCVAGFVCVYCV